MPVATTQENFDKGVEYRLQGNESFKKANYKQAVTNYYNALLYLKALGNRKEEDNFKAKSEEQLVMIYNNMSAVFAKQDKWDRVLHYATLAKDLDPENTKSKFRMGQANLQLERVELAKTLLEEVLEKNPEDTLVKKELAKVAAAMKQKEEKEKLIYRAMMTKLTEEKK